jgi:hypothetical protein
MILARTAVFELRLFVNKYVSSRSSTVATAIVFERNESTTRIYGVLENVIGAQPLTTEPSLNT